MTGKDRMFLFLLPCLLLSSSCSDAFTIHTSPTKINKSSNTNNKWKYKRLFSKLTSFEGPIMTTGHVYNIRPSTGTTMKMAFGDDGDDDGPGLLASVGILFVMILFVGSGLLPILDGGGQDLSIADSVVTTTQINNNKSQNFESDNQERLSRSTIQEKLSSIPIFYVVNDSGRMRSDIYLSYEEAKDAAMSSSTVKATSLDQVMYPLILKRGRMRMAPPPKEVANAELELTNPATITSYRLVASKAASEQAKEFHMDLQENDIPLFVADRLAFASSKGPQLPLFVDKDDCILSYQRLREGKSSLPEQPNVRTTTLLETLNSMEKGTRPGVSQLAFYATAEDVTRAAEMID